MAKMTASKYRRLFVDNQPKEEKVEIVNEKPPVWDNVCLAFNLKPHNVVFTYGNKIYNPDAVELPDHIIEHEKIHMKQQAKVTTELWWGKYLRDEQFRVDQEAQAYAIQYLFICRNTNDRNRRARVLFDLANFLSGPLYNHAITHAEASKLIRRYAGEA